jgi:hypothetical protein
VRLARNDRAEVGTVLINARRQFEDESSLHKKDLGTIDRKVVRHAVNSYWRCLDRLGNNFRIQGRKLALAFHESMVSVGLWAPIAEPAVIAVADDEQPKEARAFFFWDKVL